MTQTTSFKNKFSNAFALFKWELKSCSGTLAVYAILAAVFSAIILTLCLAVGFISANDGSSTESTDDIIKGCVIAFQAISSYTIYYLSIIFTIIYTIRIFSYLHNKRKADLYGSLPISRVTLFVSKSVTGFLFSVVPAFFFLCLISIISICFGQPLVNEVTAVYAKLLLGSLACISAYGITAVCCGTTLNTVLMFLAVCIAYPVSAIFIKGVLNGFFYGLNSGILYDSLIMNALNPLAAYDGINALYWLIFTAVCFVGAVFLVKRRKAERAQESFAYYLPCHIVKLLVAFLAGTFLGMVFGALDVFGDGYAGFVFGFILGSVPAFIISHLIFYKGFTKLLRTSASLLGLAVIVIALMGVCNFDLFGYNSFEPTVDTISGAGFVDSDTAFIAQGESYASTVRKSADDFTDTKNIKLIVNHHKKFLNHMPKSSRDKFRSAWMHMFEDNTIRTLGSTERSFAYKLNNGKTVTRSYSITDFYDFYNNDSLFGFSEQNEYLIITSTKTYFEKHSALMNMSSEGSAEMIVKTYNTDKSASLTASAASDRAKIIEAYKKDISENKINPVFEFSDTGFLPDSQDISIIIKHRGSDNPNKSGINSVNFLENLLYVSDLYAKYESIQITPDCVNTINTLKELGILRSDNILNIDSKYIN